MGMIFDATEMHAMMDDMNKQLSRKIDELEDLITELNELINDNVLEGQAYDHSKRYFKVVWIPILKGMQGMCRATIEGNSRYLKSFHVQVDPSENTYINTDYIEEGIERLLTVRQMLENDIDNSSLLDMNLFENLYETNRLQQLIENLYYFDIEANSYYEEAKRYYNIVQHGLGLVSKSTRNEVDFKIDISQILEWAIQFPGILVEASKDNWVGKMNRMYYEGGDGYFGANQSSPLDKYDIRDEQIIKTIQKYYPELHTESEILEFLNKLEREGCSYSALVNTIFVHFYGREEAFKKIFGFDMYIEENGIKKYNFDYVLVDLYCSMDNKRGIPGWFELRDDLYNGTIPADRDYIAEKYLKSKGIDAEYITSVNTTTTPNVFGVEPVLIKPIQTNFITPTVENYSTLSEYGQVMLVCGAGVQLQGTGDTDDSYLDGWHVMTVLGYDSEKEAFIVSSWGEKYYVAQESIMNPAGISNKVFPIPNSLEVIIYE